MQVLGVTPGVHWSCSSTLVMWLTVTVYLWLNWHVLRRAAGVWFLLRSIWVGANVRNCFHFRLLQCCRKTHDKVLQVCVPDSWNRESLITCKLTIRTDQMFIITLSSIIQFFAKTSVSLWNLMQWLNNPYGWNKFRLLVPLRTNMDITDYERETVQ